MPEGRKWGQWQFRSASYSEGPMVWELSGYLLYHGKQVAAGCDHHEERSTTLAELPCVWEETETLFGNLWGFSGFSVSKLPFSFALHLSGHSGPESVCSRQRHPMKLSTSPIGKSQLSPLRYGKELCPYANYSSFVKKFLTGYWILVLLEILSKGP